MTSPTNYKKKMVKAWQEQVVIPTYEVGTPEKNPIFLEKRVYQGSCGSVYPYQVIEHISNEKKNKAYEAVYLENEYIKVMILPQLGGRVQMAYDKIKKRHFIYYNHVIKPALVGLLGPWISGGIEFNWPQHHRPSTYMPVDYTIEKGKDESVTVWVNEQERMSHQKGMAGFTLRPGCAYLEIKGRVSNPTPLPQTFLWWANPAVEVNEAYQSIFPPDVNAVFDHGKRAVSSFPIATGTYYKMDYSAGVNISNYKNIKVPTSYMAVNSKNDFEGGYENDTKGGMLHVASHHFSPGKKQWTWGNGDFGRAWDKNLTDDVNASDSLPIGSIRTGFRPYIELMAGIYTENQPDFTWLMPYEEKQFTQYFMPYRDLGMVKQASKDFIFNYEQTSEGLRFKVLATSERHVRISFNDEMGNIPYEKDITLSPTQVFEDVLTDSAHVHACKFCIHAFNSCNPTPIFECWITDEQDDLRPIPEAAEAALLPEDTKTIDQLYLTGLHLEQYRHATWSALDYYEEALRRDPNDIRCLNQLGLWFLRRGRFEKAEHYLRKAVRIWQKRNPNPYDGEPLFNLALCLKFQQRLDEAYNWFWKSTWNKAWADAGFYQAACISLGKGHYEDALEEIERCLISNSHNHKARALKATILRMLGRKEEALQWIHESYAIDLFNYGCIFEEYLLKNKACEPLERLKRLMHRNIYNYHSLALDYAQEQQYDEATEVLDIAIKHHAAPSPLTYYYLGWFSKATKSDEKALEYFQRAEAIDPCGCLPNRLEDIICLSLAKRTNSKGARAPYYLGCLYYDKRQYDVAIENWELSAKLDPQFPTVWRNLALARFNKQNQPEEALTYMERAFNLDKTDARVFMELDQLRKRLQQPHVLRLSHFDQHPNLVVQRDDLLLEYITLLNQLARYDEARNLLTNHLFHPWEGGEGKVSLQYQICRLEPAKIILRNPSATPHQLHSAIMLLEECLIYPQNLGEGKLYGTQDNDFYFFLGLCYQRLGKERKAYEMWQYGTVGPTEPAAAMYYNDAKPDKIFYAGLCYRALGEEDKARGLFYKLINYGRNHYFDTVRMDYFAVSLPDLLIWEGDLQMQNKIHCSYMLSLGYAGIGEKEKSVFYLNQVKKKDINHQGIQALINWNETKDL